MSGYTVEIDLPKTVDSGTFARYVPFGDKREVIVRRGKQTGFQYGFPQGERRVEINGREFRMVTFVNILSPPVALPGQPLLDDPDDSYRPTHDVLYLPDTEVMVPRTPARRGFSDTEVAQILAAIRLVPAL